MFSQLYPESSPFYARASLVSDLLLPRGAGQTLASVVCLSSFEPSWSFRIEQSERLGKRARVSRVNGLEPDAVATHDDASVTETFAEALCSVWFEMLRKVTYASKRPRGLDGVAYHFMTRREGTEYAAYSWSPQPASIAGRMVEVADAIKNAVALETLSLLEPKLLSQLQEIDTPLPANDLAYEEAKRTIEKSLASRELGVFSDEEIALALVSGLDSSPLALAQTLHLLDLIPADIRELMKSG